MARILSDRAGSIQAGIEKQDDLKAAVPRTRDQGLARALRHLCPEPTVVAHEVLLPEPPHIGCAPLARPAEEIPERDSYCLLRALREPSRDHILFDKTKGQGLCALLIHGLRPSRSRVS